MKVRRSLRIPEILLIFAVVSVWSFSGCSSGVTGPVSGEKICPPCPCQENSSSGDADNQYFYRTIPSTIVDRGTGGGIGYYTSLAFDSNDYPHISYYDLSNGDLRYASLEPGEGGKNRWRVEIVDQIGDVGSYSSLVLTPGNLPRISYRDETEGKLKLASYDGTSWHTEILDADGNNGMGSSLALDPNGYLYVSYIKAGTYDLRFLTYTPTGSTAETVTRGLGQSVSFATSLALDPQGVPFITYYNSLLGDLMLAYRDPLIMQWISLAVDDSEDDVGRYNSLVIDSYGSLHICYQNDTRGELWYAKYDPDRGVWTRDTVDTEGSSGAYCRIALSSRENPIISYFEEANGDLKVALKSYDRWQIYRYDTAGITGLWTSIAVNSQGAMGLAYRSQNPDALRFRYAPTQ
ncbi:MAG: hypothetical protein PHE84_14635 [bacterium]|nr:hypothetical protein [bacterium]